MCQMVSQTVRVLDPSTHLRQCDPNCGKIQYVNDPYNKQAKFFPNIKTFKCTEMVFSVYYLGCMVVNISTLFAV